MLFPPIFESGWTVDTLKEYVESRLKSHETALITALAAHDKRLEQMNEIRGQLQDQALTFMPRAECDRMLKELGSKIEVLQSKADSTNWTFSGMKGLWAIMLGAIAVGSLIVAYVK